MEIFWASRHIPIRGELYAEVRVSADGRLTLGTYNDDVQAGELSTSTDTFTEIARAIDQGVAQSRVAQGR